MSEPLGYMPDGTPIERIKPGMIATACIVSCSECRRVLRGMGGPLREAKCVGCWQKQIEQEEDDES
jgi:hypothetical protein